MGILRFILALSVIIAHTNSIFGISIVGGGTAVSVFFIISGFYMALVLSTKYNKEGGFWLFISNRVYRLFPLYWVVLLFTIISSLVAGLIVGNYFKLQLYLEYYLNIKAYIILIFTNIFILFQDIILFLGLDISSGDLFLTKSYIFTSPALHKFILIPQSWSISLELMFYLLIPFIIKNKKIILVMLIVSVLIKLYILYILNLNFDPWTYRFFPSEVHLFLLGVISYFIFEKYKIEQHTIYHKILYIIFFTYLILYSNINIFGYNKIILILFSFLIIPLLFDFTKNFRVDRYIGELSYPMYLSHILVKAYVYILIEKSNLTLNLGVVTVLSTVVLSIFLVEVFGKKIEIFRQKRFNKFKNKVML